jgi:hypothetical protein
MIFSAQTSSGEMREGRASLKRQGRKSAIRAGDEKRKDRSRRLGLRRCPKPWLPAMPAKPRGCTGARGGGTAFLPQKAGALHRRRLTATASAKVPGSTSRVHSVKKVPGDGSSYANLRSRGRGA